MSWWSVALLCCLATVAQGQDKVSVTFLLDYSVRTFDGFFPGEYDQLKQFVLKFAESYGISADHRVSLFDVKEKESFERISCSAQQTYQQFEAQVNDLNNSESTFDSINLIKGINAAIQHLSTDACGQDGFKHYIIILTASAQYVNDPKEALTALYAQASTPTTFVLYKDDGQEERKQFAIITRGQEGAMIRVEKDYSEAQFAASILQQISGDTPAVYGEWGSYSQCNVNCQKTRSRTCNENCQNAETSQTVSCEGDQCPPTYGQWSGFSVCSSSCTQSRSRECLSSCVNIPASDRVQTQGCTGGNCVTTPVYGEWGSYSQCNVNCQKTRSRTCTENCQNAELSQTTSCEGDQCPPQYGEWSEFSACSTSCTQVRTRTCTRSCFFPDAALTDTRACVEGLCQATQVLTQWSGFGDCSESCNRNTPVRTRTRSCIPASLCEGVKFVDTTPCNREFNCPEYRRSDWGAWSDCSATCQNAGQIPFQVRRRDYCLEEFDTGLCSTANMIEFKNCNTEECPEVLTCENLQISFIFVMDSSASVSELQWAQEKTFVKNFVQKSELGENENVRVGIVNYGSTARIEADCNTITTKSQFNSVIDDIKRANGGTAINSGLLEAQKIYKNCQRDDEQPIIIFMTDGKENIEFDPQVIENTEADIKREAVIYAMGIANGVNSSEILRIGTNNINGETELLYRLVGGFLELSEIDPEELYPIVLGARCTLKGIWAAWGAYSTCSVFCGAQGTQLRERNCASPNNPQLLQQDCDTQGVIAKYEARTCSAECSAFNDWGEWSECSNECNQISPIPTQTRTRSCDNALGGSSCNGLFAETRQCNTNVACQGTLSGWQAFEACSDTCRMGSALPLKRRQRFCVGKTLDGDCNGAGLEEFEACNQNVPCPGVAGEWSEYGVCEASCNTAGDGPYRHRQRQCVDFSTWDEDYLGCSNIAMTSKKLCKQNEPCKGEYGEWSDWGQCSATCHNNDDINNPPTQVRTRVCQGDTLNGGCDGDSFQTQSCNVAKACPGKLTAWEDWPACPATCQMEMLPPTHTRVRNCVGGTWSGNCGEENALFETKDCSVEILCPGVLTEWTEYGACGASCNTAGNGPFMTRFRECIDVSKWNPSFQGCVNQPRSEDRACHQNVPCKGLYKEWSTWSTCTETCQSDPNNLPTQFRTRVCEGDTLGGGCEGDASESQTCSVNVPCPGVLTQWSDFTQCSHDCHPDDIESPTRQRTRQCLTATLGANCGGAALLEVENCNFQEPCQGQITQWSEWTACPATCQPAFEEFLHQYRSRVCEDNTHGGDCFNKKTNQEKRCVENLPCPGVLTQWSEFTQCSESCQSDVDVIPTQKRTRVCLDATLNANCNNALLEEIVECSKHVGCPGIWTEWGPFTDCSHTCQSSADLVPSKWRQRFCTGRTFDGLCPAEGDVTAVQTIQCNAAVVCPVIGTWSKWSDWSECSETCDNGITKRMRTCSESFGTGETDCEGDAEEEQVCNLGDCPKVCPIGKRCSCNAAKVWNFVPSFNQFAEGEVTVENVNAAVDYLNHYTPDVVNQTCAACNKMRLQSVINQLESHLSSLRLVRDHLEAAKDEMRDVLNCNQVIGNYVGLWELYDFMYQRCAMLNGVEIELNAIHARFETALETCESYGWFHRLLRKVWSKM